MTINAYLIIIRQYRMLSERKHVNYNNAVDEITDQLLAEQAKPDSLIKHTPEEIRALSHHEYPARLRTLPPSRL